MGIAMFAEDPADRAYRSGLTRRWHLIGGDDLDIELCAKAACVGFIGMRQGGISKLGKKKGRHLGRPANPLRQFIRGRWRMYNR